MDVLWNYAGTCTYSRQLCSTRKYRQFVFEETIKDASLALLFLSSRGELPSTRKRALESPQGSYRWYATLSLTWFSNSGLLLGIFWQCLWYHYVLTSIDVTEDLKRICHPRFNRNETRAYFYLLVLCLKVLSTRHHLVYATEFIIFLSYAFWFRSALHTNHWISYRNFYISSPPWAFRLLLLFICIYRALGGEGVIEK